MVLVWYHTERPHFVYVDNPSTTGLVVSKNMKLARSLPIITSLCVLVYGFEPLRFLQQSSRFVQFPGSSSSAKRIVLAPGDVLYRSDQTSSSNELDFAPLDDIVMGGASQSNFADGKWKGTVTDANNGGFIGIRSRPNGKVYDLTACKGLQVTARLVRSPKNKRLRFKFATRDTTDFNGITWATSVDAVVGKPTIWKVPIRNQKPTRFARTVPNEYFASDILVGVQFVYSKFEYDGDLNPFFALGDMELEIDEVKVY
jgi:hypothetical protein